MGSELVCEGKNEGQALLVFIGLRKEGEGEKTL
jgi:hypothetical protein